MQEQINELQVLEQNLQNTIDQIQSIRIQINEIDSALTELETTEESYVILGNIMLKKDKDEIIKENKINKERLNLRFNSLENQQKKLVEKIKELQKQIIGSNN